MMFAQRVSGILLLACLPATALAADPAEPAPPDLSAVQDELRQLRDMGREMKAEVTGLRSENEQLQQRVSQLEGDADARQAAEAFRLKIYGFASAYLGRNFVGTGSYWDGYLADRWTFGLSDFNLFTDAHLGDRWRFLGEVRFLEMPNGSQTVQGTSFVRTNTSVLDPFYGSQVRWGGVLIERAQIEYRLSDTFGAIAGRFLTPYGIWNVEHGAPVLIPIRMPFPVVNELVPRAQTGVQVFGRVFPTASLQVEYALTASNGRGPMDEVFDLDDNKALGLRLRAAWEHGHSRIAAGTYLYAGRYTDRAKSITMGPGGISLPAPSSVQYDEQVAAFDLLLEHGPVRLQGEYMQRAVKYADGKRDLNLMQTGYNRDYVQKGAYGLAAVRLPVPGIDLRAFGMLEWNTMPTAATSIKIYTGGLNYRVTPSVVFKGEIYRIAMDSPVPRYESWWGVSSQIAVSF